MCKKIIKFHFRDEQHSVIPNSFSYLTWCLGFGGDCLLFPPPPPPLPLLELRLDLLEEGGVGSGGVLSKSDDASFLLV